MIPVVDATWWDSVVNRSHQVSFRFELRTWTGALIQNLYPAAGSISISLNGGVTRSLNLKLNDDGTLMPTTSNTKLSPFSDNEIWVYYRVSDAGVTDEICVGIFRVGQLSLTYGDNAIELNLTGYDRAILFTSFNYPSMSKIASGTYLVSGAASTVLSALTDLLQSYRSLNLNVSIPTGISTAKLPATFGKYLGGGYNTPWDDLANLAESVGCYAYFSADGVLTLTSIPLMETAESSKTFAQGSNLLGLSRSYDSSNFCNVLKLDGVSTAITPLTVSYSPEADDSPFATSLIGTRVMTAQNEWVVDSTQIKLAAQGMYQFVRGYEVEASILPDPRLDILDLVRVTSDAMSLDTKGIITGLTLPLDAESEMRVTVRVRGY